MKLEALFPRWRASSTNQQVPWDHDFDLANSDRFGGLLGIIVSEQSDASNNRPHEFQPICRSIATGDAAYASSIADALRTELGQSHRATKTVMRWTGASDRTAKNWLNGSYGPSGTHLIQLARESDTVLAAVLGLAGRNRHLLGADLLQIRAALAGATQLIDELLQAEQPR